MTKKYSAPGGRVGLGRSQRFVSFRLGAGGLGDLAPHRVFRINVL
jgi:hypothetical protein